MGTRLASAFVCPSRSDDGRATRSEMAGAPNFFFASTSPTSPKDGRHEDVGRRAPSPAGRRSATIPADGTSSLEPATPPLPTVSSTSHRARPQFSPLRTDEVPHAISSRRRRHKLFSTTHAIALPRAAPVSSSSTLVAAMQPRFCDLAAHAEHRRGFPPTCSGPHLRLPVGMRARVALILAYFSCCARIYGSTLAAPLSRATRSPRRSRDLHRAARSRPKKIDMLTGVAYVCR